MPKGYGYGGESTMDKKGALPKMKGQHGMMMKDQGQPMMKHGKGPKMSAELAFMPAVRDMIGGRASSIVNAGARSRMSGQPQMGHKGSPAGMYGPLNMPGNSPEHARNPAKDDGHLHYDRTTNQPRKKK